LKAARHHTDNCDSGAAQGYLLSDNVSVGAEATLPQTMSENNYLPARGLVFFN